MGKPGLRKNVLTFACGEVEHVVNVAGGGKDRWTWSLLLTLKR